MTFDKYGVPVDYSPNVKFRKTTDIEDATRYACSHPLIIGHDFSREPDRTAVVIERPRNIGKSFAMALERWKEECKNDRDLDRLLHDPIWLRPLRAHDFNFTITQRNPMRTPEMKINLTIGQENSMQDTTPTKIFTTKDVPGFEDGHPLKLHRPLVLGSPFASSDIEFIANRTTEEGVILNVRIPCTPEAFAAHVRVKNAPKAPEKKP